MALPDIKAALEGAGRACGAAAACALIAAQTTLLWPGGHYFWLVAAGVGCGYLARVRGILGAAGVAAVYLAFFLLLQSVLALTQGELALAPDPRTFAHAAVVWGMDYLVAGCALFTGGLAWEKRPRR